jgi:hypothetical protein
MTKCSGYIFRDGASDGHHQTAPHLACAIATEMNLTEHLNIALKEWSATCESLRAGRQILLLRKGGIYESAGGFEIENRQFLFFPTYLHQNPQMLKDDALRWYEQRSAEPETVTINLAGAITDIIRIANRAQMDTLDAEHIWTKPLIDMRFNYKPQNPLYLLLVRAYELPRAVTVKNTPAYAGCKSWVPLDEPIDVSTAKPVLDDALYQSRRQRHLDLIEHAI